jgi:hypothetical protein
MIAWSFDPTCASLRKSRQSFVWLFYTRHLSREALVLVPGFKFAEKQSLVHGGIKGPLTAMPRVTAYIILRERKNRSGSNAHCLFLLNEAYPASSRVWI